MIDASSATFTLESWPLNPGSVVSGRFQIEGLQTLIGQIVVYSAKDQRTQRPVSLWAIPPGILRPDVVRTRTLMSDGSWRWTKTDTDVDTYGQPTQVIDYGDAVVQRPELHGG